MELNKDCVRDVLRYIEQNNVYKKNSFGKDQLHIVSLDELCQADSINYEINIIAYALEKMEEYDLIKFGSLKNHSNINKGYVNYHVSEITSHVMSFWIMLKMTMIGIK